jgi:hypothetical protein
MTGAGAIVEILKAAGLLKEEAGKLVATFEEEADGPIPMDGSPVEIPEPSGSSVLATVNAGGDVAVNIHLHVRCTADDLEDLAPRLKALLKEISGPQSSG